MLFPFLQYVSPIWYFNLPCGGRHPYFPDYDGLTMEERMLLELDPGYSSWEVSRLDAAYQAWHKGFILSNPALSLDRTKIRPIVTDNYRFLRRYFHPLWSWYVLLLRLITLHNPLREISGFLKNIRVQRLDLYKTVYPHPLMNTSIEAGTMESPSITESPSLKVSESQSHPVSKSHSPKVSVIIPTLNRYPYLKDALHDLERQDYGNFEVIVVDQSEPFHPEFYAQFQLDLQLIRQEVKALWLARNTAVKTSDAEYLLLYDDDSRTEHDWISQHLRCLEHFEADISSGVSISKVGARVPENYTFFRWSDQLDTGNVMIKREVFRRIGLFDRQFEGQRMGDGEFGLRAYLAGFRNISNPLAGRLHLKVAQGGLREMGSWDAFRPKRFLAPRPVPSVLYLTRKFFGNQAAFNILFIGTAPSLIPYRYKASKTRIILSIPLGFILIPFVVVQLWRSYRISALMLKQGGKIEFFHHE